MIGSGRNLLWLVPLALLLGWPLYGGPIRSFLAPPELAMPQSVSHSDPQSAPRNANEEQDGIEERFTMNGVRFFQELAGERQWRIESRQMRSGDDQRLLLTGVEAVLFSQGTSQLEIAAKGGGYDPENERLELEGDVRLLDASGFVLQTPALVHEEKKGSVSSRAVVLVVHQGMQVQARNLDYHLADGHYLLSGNVRLTMP